MRDHVTAIGHRGAPLRARENTLESIITAINLGAEWVEVDAKVTADGIAIVLHDDTFERLWGDSRRVSDVSFAELRASPTGHLAGVPLLSEAIEITAVRNCTLLIDIADTAIAETVARTGAVAATPEAVAFTGDPEGLARIRSLLPQAVIALSWETPGLPDDDVLNRVRPDFVNQASHLVDADFVAVSKRRSMAVSTYTVDSESEMRRLLDLGVNAIISNDIELLRRVVDEHDSELDADAALLFAHDLATWASTAIRTSSPGKITVKENPADVVTEIDLFVEREIRQRIADRYPGHAVDGEEYGPPSQDAAYTWYLDPIDGTTNFANALPWSSFSIALADRHGPLVGIVADPFRGTVFSARRGGGARVDGVPSRCSTTESLAGTVILTEWNGHEPWPGMTETIAAITSDYGTIRIMGSSALALAHAAVGHASAALIGSYHGVDDMAGVLIAVEAGAVVRGRHGESNPGPNGVMVAAPGVADRVAELWR